LRKNCSLEIDADINTCLNTTRKAGYNPPIPSKIEAYAPIQQSHSKRLEAKATTTRRKTL
jgi:transposase